MWNQIDFFFKVPSYVTLVTDVSKRLVIESEYFKSILLELPVGDEREVKKLSKEVLWLVCMEYLTVLSF